MAFSNVLDIYYVHQGKEQYIFISLSVGSQFSLNLKFESIIYEEMTKQ